MSPRLTKGKKGRKWQQFDALMKERGMPSTIVMPLMSEGDTGLLKVTQNGKQVKSSDLGEKCFSGRNSDTFWKVENELDTINNPDCTFEINRQALNLLENLKGKGIKTVIYSRVEYDTITNLLDADGLSPEQFDIVLAETEIFKPKEVGLSIESDFVLIEPTSVTAMDYANLYEKMTLQDIAVEWSELIDEDWDDLFGTDVKPKAKKEALPPKDKLLKEFALPEAVLLPLTSDGDINLIRVEEPGGGKVAWDKVKDTCFYENSHYKLQESNPTKVWNQPCDFILDERAIQLITALRQLGVKVGIYTNLDNKELNVLGKALSIEEIGDAYIVNADKGSRDKLIGIAEFEDDTTVFVDLDGEVTTTDGKHLLVPTMKALAEQWHIQKVITAAPPEYKAITTYKKPGIDCDWVGDVLGCRSPIESDISTLKEEYGIGAIITLQAEKTLSKQFQKEFEVIRIPIRDFTPPTESQMDKFIKVVDEQVAKGNKVMVHCMAGHGRTGTMIAGRIASRDIRPDIAIAFTRANRAGTLETDNQINSVFDTWCRHRGIKYKNKAKFRKMTKKHEDDLISTKKKGNFGWQK